MEKEPLRKKIASELILSKNTGATIRKWRTLFNIPQVELAKKLGVTPSVICDYESGKIKNPGLSIIRKIIDALIRIDKEKGGEVISFLSKPLSKEKGIISLKDFSSPKTVKNFCRFLGARVISKSSNEKIYGYTLIESPRVILEFYADKFLKLFSKKSPKKALIESAKVMYGFYTEEFLKLFGQNPKRALVFTDVQSGRSVMVAIKVGISLAKMLKPGLVILHNCEKQDAITKRIAKTEKIPLAVCDMPLPSLVTKLESF